MIYITSKTGVLSYCIKTENQTEPLVQLKIDNAKLTKQLIKNNNYLELFNVNNKLNGVLKITRV